MRRYAAKLVGTFLLVLCGPYFCERTFHATKVNNLWTQAPNLRSWHYDAQDKGVERGG